MLDNFYFFKGRVALYAILKAIGVNEGDEVILPGFTCVVVPNAIIYLGARPVYVDIDSETYNIDTQIIEEKITKKTRAIIAQHTFGIPAEMDRIIEITKEHNLYLIEDSCHAIGSKYKGNEVGTFGDAAFFSSQWSKPVTTGLGGWAVINDSELKANMERIYSEFTKPSYKEDLLLKLQYFTYSYFFKPSLFWFAQSTYRTLSMLGISLGSSSKAELECEMPEGYEKRMSQWQADLLKKKLSKIDEVIAHRKLIASINDKFLENEGIKTVKLSKEFEPVFLRYPLLVKDKGKVLYEAKKRRIEIGDWFVSPIHPNINGWDRAGYKKGMCPIAEEVCEHVINLPTHQGINKRESQYILNFLKTLKYNIFKI